MKTDSGSKPGKLTPESHPKSKSEIKRGRMVKRVALIAFFGLTIGFGAYGILRSLQQDRPNEYQPPSVEVVDPRIPAQTGASWQEIDDPAQDGWETEVFNGKAMEQLKVVGKWLTHSDQIDPAAVGKLVTRDFLGGSLRPADLVTAWDDRHLRVERLAASLAGVDFRKGPGLIKGKEFKGPAGFVEVLRQVAVPFAKATEVRFKVKVFRVGADANEVATRQYFSISGRTEAGMLEQNATWDIGWKSGEGDEPPTLRWLRLVDFEEVGSKQEGGGLFVDCTASVLGGNPVYADQFLKGMNHWFQRVQDRSPLELFGNPGLTVGDVNGDGLDDLYVCQEGGLPNRLFIRNSDGTATEQSAAWGCDWLQSSRSALLVDLDNDGDQDLVVAIHGGVVVAENVEGVRFVLRDVLATTDDTMSLSAVDYDLDGKLDLYVCGYFRSEKIRGEDSGLGGNSSGFVLHDANNGGGNSLFRNRISDAGWRFDDVTVETGLNENNSRWSLAASWEDFDNDGDQDLYVANDYGRDNLYRNDAGKNGMGRSFVDISREANVEDSATGMSIAWGDYNRDGRMDAFVSNMWSSAGNRIAYQSKFLEDSTEEHRRRIQRLARGNTLLKNQGNGVFADQSAETGIEMGRWAWGSHFVDLNNDGWEDLVVSNGYITTDDTGDL